MVSNKSSQLAACLLLAMMGSISALMQKDVPQAALDTTEKVPQGNTTKDVQQSGLATEAPEPENTTEKVPQGNTTLKVPQTSETAKPDHQEKPIEDLNWAKHATVQGNISKPRMIVSQGCENNELVIDHARALLKIHGIHTPWHGALSVSDIADLGNADNSSSSDIPNELDGEELSDSAGSELSLGELGKTFVSPDESDEENDEADAGEEADETEAASAASSASLGEEEDEEGNSFRASVYRMHNLLHAKGTTMFLKGTIGKDNNAILDKKLVKLGTLAVVVTRKNRIDQVVCMIKDCVNETLGYPTQGGNKSDVCYKRHKQETSDYKAYIRPASLAPTMAHLELRSQSMGRQLKNNGYFKAQIFDSEDLLDFTFDKNAVGRGVKAWTHLLQAWRVRAMPNVIQKYLEQKAGTRQPSSQKDSILNYDAVKEALGNHSRYSWMLRE